MEFGHQFFFGLFVLEIGNTAIHRANRRALGFIIVSDAFGALGRVDSISLFPRRDRLVGAFRFAGAAIDAFVCDHKSHFISSSLE
jgi:hypothetical protein